MVYFPDVAQFAVSVESTEGSAETLAAADCKNLVGGINWSYEIPAHLREVVSDTHDRHSAIIGGPRKSIVDFAMPLKGSGTAGTAPGCDAILEAMNFLGANTTSSETYDTTVHTTNKSVTMGWKVGTSPTVTLDYIMHGARGSGSLVLDNGAIPMLNAHFEGVYAEPAAGTFFSSLTEETSDPAPVLGSGLFTYDSVALHYSTFTINIENDLEPIHDTADDSGSGIHSVVITKQRITFNMTVKNEIVGTYNFMNKLTTNSEGALSLQIGSTAGNIITITAPKCQFTDIQPSEQGYQTLDITGICSRNTDADPSALTLAFT
jgi:hypothetical protein